MALAPLRPGQPASEQDGAIHRDFFRWLELIRKALTSIAAPQSAALTGDVALTLTDTFYNGPSLVLTPGTWLVTAAATVRAGGVVTVATCKLCDGGTTVWGSAEQTIAAGQYRATPLVALVTLSSAATVYLSAASTAVGSALKATPTNNGANCTNTATTLTAVQVA